MNDSGLEAEVVEDLESVRADWQRLALASRNVFARTVSCLMSITVAFRHTMRCGAGTVIGQSPW